MQQKVIRFDAQNLGGTGPAGTVEVPRHAWRWAQGRGTRFAEPDPDERRGFDDRVRRHPCPGRHVLLRRHVGQTAVGLVAEAVIAADDAVAVEPAFGQWERAVYAAVLQGHHLAGGAAVQDHVLVQQTPGEQSFADLIAERGHIPAIQRVVGSHRSSTSLSDRERETQIMMVLFSAFSESLSTESR